jgi:dihydrofolate reductase
MKVTLYMAVTANGWIARGDHTVAWSNEEWQEYARAIKEAGAYIIGNATYQMMIKEGEFEKIGNPATCVLTHSPKLDEGAIMFAVTPEEALGKLEARGFTRVIIGGGSQCNAAFLRAGLVDEVLIDVEPLDLDSMMPLLLMSQVGTGDGSANPLAGANMGNMMQMMMLMSMMRGGKSENGVKSTSVDSFFDRVRK